MVPVSCFPGPAGTIRPGGGCRSGHGSTARAPACAAVLLTRGGPELHDDLGRDAPAVFDLNALGPGPHADGGGVGRAVTRPAPAAARPPGTGRRPAGGIDIP